MLKNILSALGTKAAAVIAGAAVVTAAVVITAVVVLTGEESYRVLKVFELNGTAAVERESAGELDAYVGMNLESGDVITVNSGTMRISLDSNKYILLEEGTVLELVAEGTATDSKTMLNLREGAILNEITESLSSNSLYEVNAPKSTMAVRGTSFYVSARQLEDGSYVIDVTTFHGTVSTQLYDENGNKKGSEIYVGEDKSVKIMAENTGSSGSDVDGTAYYVITDAETGELRPVEDGETPTFDTIYIDIPDEIKDMVLSSDSSNLLKLSDAVLAAIRGISEEIKEENPAETTAATTTAATTTTKKTTAIGTMAVNSNNKTNGKVNINAINIVNNDDLFGNNAAATTTSKRRPTITTTAFTKPSSNSSPSYSYILNNYTATTTTTTPPETTTATSKTDYAPHYTIIVTTTPTTTTLPVTTTTAKTTVATTSETTTTESAAVTASVVFTYSDGTTATLSIEVGEAIGKLPAIPERTGYTGKWVVYVDDVENEITADTIVMSDTVVQLTYTPNKYTVTFSVGVETASTVTAEYLTKLTADDIPDVPEKTGYTGKWVIDGTTTEFTTSTVITGDTTVSPSYTINSYIVTFKNDDGNDVSTVSADYNTTISADDIPDVPEKTGYTGKWVIDGTTAEFTDETVITEDMTITLSYSINSYAINYVASYNSSVIIETKTLVFGAAIPRIEIPSEYEAVDTDEDGNMDYMVWNWDTADIPEKVTDDEDITVPYIGYDDVVEYRIDMGSEYVHKFIEVGETYTFPEAPDDAEEKLEDGYVFQYWYSTGSGGTNVESRKPGRDVYYPQSHANISGGETITATANMEYSFEAQYLEIDGIYFKELSASIFAPGETATVYPYYSAGGAVAEIDPDDVTWNVYEYDEDGNETEVSSGTTLTTTTDSDGNVMLLLTVASNQSPCTLRFSGVSEKYGDLYSYGDCEIEVTVPVDSAHFTDENFLSFVSDNFDSDKDGYLSSEEIYLVTTVDINNDTTISSLKGIEYLTSLTKIDCSDTSITSLDISNNTELTTLYCFSTPLTTLNVSTNTALTDLRCYDTSISSLDVSDNTALEILWCSDTSIASLDVSANTALENLYCYNTSITSLDVSANTALTGIICHDTNIAFIDVTNNTALTDLQTEDCSYYIGSVTSFSVSAIDGIDKSKISNVSGANYDSSTGTFSNITGDVTYTYDCGNGFTETFTLTITS